MAMTKVADYRYIIAEKDPETHISHITFNRPEKLNATNAEMSGEISAALADLEWDDAVKVIIFKGNGTSFSTGADLGTIGRQEGGADPKPGRRPQPPDLRAA